MLGFLSKIYSFFVKKVNKQYDSSGKNIRKVDLPVISIGNLLSGGTGKTPFVEMLVHYLQKRKHFPGVVGKGYKRKESGLTVVSDGKQLQSDLKGAGDEMLLLGKKLKCPIIVHDDKSEAAFEIAEKFDIDSIIVDDGFQHRKLHRDLDILLITNETLESDELLPKGRLREPLKSAERADIICMIGNAPVTDELKTILRPEQVLMRAHGRSGKPYVLYHPKKTGHKGRINFRKGLIAVSGIANPHRFSDMLKRMKYNVIDTIEFPDHNNYSEKDIDKIARICEASNCPYLGITEKDAVKLENMKDALIERKINILVFPFYLRIVRGKRYFDKKLNGMFHDYIKKVAQQ